MRNFRLILKDSFLVFCIKILGSVLNFLFVALITNNLGAKEAGIYFLTFSIVSFLIPIGSIGMFNVGLKLSSLGKANGDVTYINRLIKFLLILVTTTSLVIAFSIFTFSDDIALLIFSNKELSKPLSIMIWALPCMVLYTLLAHISQGLGRVIQSMIITGPMIYFILLATLYFYTVSSVSELVLVFLISSFLTVVIAISILPYKEFRGSGLSKDKELAISSVFLSGLSMMGIQIINQVNLQAGQLLIGLLGELEDVAYYAVAVKLASLVGLILMSVNRVVSPKFASLYQAKRLDELADIVKQSSRIMIGVSVPLCSVLMIFPDQLLSFFGESYKVASTLLIVLALGQLINSATGSVGFLMQMTGHERVHMRNVTMVTILSIIIGVLLIPSHGALGAAIMTSFSLLGRNIISYFNVKKTLKINTMKII